MPENEHKVYRRRRPRRGGSDARKQPEAPPRERPQSPPAAAASSADTRQQSSRRRRRRPHTPPDAPPPESAPALKMHRYDAGSLEVSHIADDIFIYTYTLRPSALLDSYQPAQSLLDKMEFEQPLRPQDENL